MIRAINCLAQLLVSSAIVVFVNSGLVMAQQVVELNSHSVKGQTTPIGKFVPEPPSGISIEAEVTTETKHGANSIQVLFRVTNQASETTTIVEPSHQFYYFIQCGDRKWIHLSMLPPDPNFTRNRNTPAPGYKLKERVLRKRNGNSTLLQLERQVTLEPGDTYSVKLTIDTIANEPRVSIVPGEKTVHAPIRPGNYLLYLRGYIRWPSNAMETYSMPTGIPIAFP